MHQDVPRVRVCGEEAVAEDLLRVRPRHVADNGGPVRAVAIQLRQIVDLEAVYEGHHHHPSRNQRIDYLSEGAGDARGRVGILESRPQLCLDLAGVGGLDLEVKLVGNRLGPLPHHRREVEIGVEVAHDVPDRLQVPEVLEEAFGHGLMLHLDHHLPPSFQHRTVHLGNGSAGERHLVDRLEERIQRLPQLLLHPSLDLGPRTRREGVLAAREDLRVGLREHVRPRAQELSAFHPESLEIDHRFVKPL
mmetsp:Transcript_1481/g.3586  ORF Transcript_1481/g.3586 Transcript_1481/m.3586 type:complete len:248 (+) Transcript_1481:2011-2754(+)